MYINVRVKRKTTEIVTLRCPVPDNLRDYEDDILDDVASDWLDDNGVEYKWFRVLKDEADHVSRVVKWIPIEDNYAEFTRLCQLENCEILYDNGEEVPHHSDYKPFACSTHFRQLEP